MRVSEETIRKKLEDAAEGFPVMAWGLGTTGLSLGLVHSVSLLLLGFGVAVGVLTYQSWLVVGMAVALAAGVYAWLRSKVKFCAVGVSPRHFICIDITRGGRFLSPALQGLSAIQFPKVIDKELSSILHYVLGDGTIHDLRFQDFRRFPDNRRAAHRLHQAIFKHVYDPSFEPGPEAVKAAK
ncbi:MAG: hypothetical protein ACE5HB_03120 [Terriglobia bacterium]